MAQGRAKLAGVPDAELPEELLKVAPGERAGVIAALDEKRRGLSGKMNGLVKQREAFIAQKKREEVKGKGDAFDVAVERALKVQVKR